MAKHYKIEVVVKETWGDEDTDKMSFCITNYLEDQGLEPVGDVGVYEVTHMPSYAEQERDARRANR